MDSQAKDITGQRFGRWTVIRRDGSNKFNKAMWWCKCDCGNEVSVLGKSLRVGDSTSCGCQRKEKFRPSPNNQNGLKHGMHGSPEYITWIHMKARCSNPKDKRYKHYGGRGIKVCDRWVDSFESFFSDMGKRPTSQHSIDRINVNGDYEPSNCRWATPTEQRHNRRDS